jgi:hypothetical protein
MGFIFWFIAIVDYPLRCFIMSSKTSWQLAHVLQPGIATRRASGMSSSHSEQCSAETAF